MAYLLAGHSVAATHRKFGNAKSTIRQIRRVARGEIVPLAGRKIPDNGSYLPTEAEIAATCRAIRSQYERSPRSRAVTAAEFCVTRVGRSTVFRYVG